MADLEGDTVIGRTISTVHDWGRCGRVHRFGGERGRLVSRQTVVALRLGSTQSGRRK
jgi:hypothetical protein